MMLRDHNKIDGNGITMEPHTNTQEYINLEMKEWLYIMKE